MVFSIRSHTYFLRGEWTWDMQSTALYCCDVMDFPGDFEGTKGLIHPEDVKNVDRILQQLQAKASTAFAFRLITTYGEIKTIYGIQVSLDNAAFTAEVNSSEPWLHSLEELALRREADFLQQRNFLADIP